MPSGELRCRDDSAALSSLPRGQFDCEYHFFKRNPASGGSSLVKDLLETILVVEDHQDSREMLADWLTHAGFRVLTAENGGDALRQVAHETPDLIVLDLMLPWISGVEVLATIREMAALRKVPVLVVTGTNTRAFELRSFGPVEVLHKPVNLGTFIPAVRELLNRKF